jgi:hypothetical protein
MDGIPRVLRLVPVFLLASVALAAPSQVRVDYTFDRPQLEQVTLAGQVYDRVVLKEAPNCGNSGEPRLPARGAYILLPFGTDVGRIEILADAQVALGSGYYIEPVSRAVPLSAAPDQALPPVPDPAIYASDSPFPGVEYVDVTTQLFRGYRMLILRLQPVQYVPASGELYYFPRLSVVVHTTPAARTPEMFRGQAADQRQAVRKVDNPAVAKTYPAASGGPRSYELLIITTSTLAPSFQPLMDYHNAHGMPTEIHTTTEIGSSNPDNIRDYIRERYLNDGIEYVLIGADDDVIAAKDLYVDTGEGYVATDMPGDLYFGCLDGTYNFDGDSRWGEPTDGDGGHDVDLVYDVYIGRACADNAADAALLEQDDLVPERPASAHGKHSAGGRVPGLWRRVGVRHQRHGGTEGRLQRVRLHDRWIPLGPAPYRHAVRCARL